MHGSMGASASKGARAPGSWGEEQAWELGWRTSMGDGVENKHGSWGAGVPGRKTIPEPVSASKNPRRWVRDHADELADDAIVGLMQFTDRF